MRQAGFLGYWAGTTIKPKGEDEVRKEVRFTDCYLEAEDMIALEKFRGEQVKIIVLPAQMSLGDLDATIDKLLRQRDQVARDSSWAQKAPPRPEQAQQTIDHIAKEAQKVEEPAEDRPDDDELPELAEEAIRRGLDEPDASPADEPSTDEDQGDEHRVEGMSRDPLVPAPDEYLTGAKCPNCEAHMPIVIPAGQDSASLGCPFCGATVSATRAIGHDGSVTSSDDWAPGRDWEPPHPQRVADDYEGTGLPLYDAGEAPGTTQTEANGGEIGPATFVQQIARFHGYAEVLFQVRPAGGGKVLVYHWTPGEPGRPDDPGKLERLPKHALRALISRRRRTLAAGRSWTDVPSGQVDDAAGAATGA